MRIYIETYGCSSSKNDSEIMAGILEKSHKIVENIDEADAVIINTCIVKSVTEQKIIHRIKTVAEKYKDKKLIVAGCMPSAQRELVKKIAPSASLVSTNSINEIEKALDGGEYFNRFMEKVCLPKKRLNPAIDIVEICSGCSHSCAYCITKFAKGPLSSYPADKIISEINEMVKNGVKEFWITGQNIAEYDYEGVDLKKLVEKITNEVRGNYFMRLGMMNPADVKPILSEIIEIYKNGRVFKFLHLPVQSGSNKILEKMNRKYTKEDFEMIINKLRKEIPDITVWTDIIVGFPGESENDFLNSINLLKEVKPDFVNISAFASRHGTKASKMKKTPTHTVKERTREMTLLVDDICKEKNRKWVGRETEMLIDEYNERNKNFLGRNTSYKQIAVKGNFSIGDTTKVKIISSEKTHLKGTYINPKALYTT